MSEPYNFAVWSASLPITWSDEDDDFTVVMSPRPWNGRALTVAEKAACLAAADHAYVQDHSLGAAAQAAYEWLSENCW